MELPAGGTDCLEIKEVDVRGLLPRSISTTMLAAAAVLLLGSSGALADGGESHPDLSPQEQLVDCAQCHSEVTPELEKEWNDSVHGIAMVKCYQCHGTFETFVATPPLSNCATCHTDKMENHAEKQGKAAGTPCWECHVPHSFAAKK